MPRPDAPPRPVCRYYTIPRGCFAGEKCHYVHGDPAVQKYAPYEENKACRFFAQGYCKRGKECWFKHVEPEVARQVDDAMAEDASCAICFEEKPLLYGLLSGCSHPFCLHCIRQWRDPEGKGIDMQESGAHKTCPMCRIKTKFITPSSRFYSQSDPRKAEVIEKYKQSMARVPCRYFTRSKSSKRFCPFGCDCFYQHANDDGTTHEFAQGVDVMMAQWHRRRQELETPGPGLQATRNVLQVMADLLPEESVSDNLARSLHEYLLRVLDSDAPEPDSESTTVEESGAAQASRSPTPISPAPSRLNTEPTTDDPRAPANVARTSELTTGDFAWMMEERRESHDEGCAPDRALPDGGR